MLLQLFAFFLLGAGIKAHSALYAQPVVDLYLLCLLIEDNRGALKFYDALLAANTVLFDIADIADIFVLQFCIENTLTSGNDYGRTAKRRCEVRGVRFEVRGARGRTGERRTGHSMIDYR